MEEEGSIYFLVTFCGSFSHAWQLLLIDYLQVELLYSPWLPCQKLFDKPTMLIDLFKRTRPFNTNLN